MSRLPSLTGLRFIAAFAVFGFHVSVAGLFARPGGVPGVLDEVFRQGATGVSFFFVLSGFVLCWSARPGDTARRFWRRRAAKIYPNHLVTALPAAVTAVSLWSVGANLLLVQAWVPDVDVYFGLNSPSWSLACEAFFYLCFPLLMLGAGRLPRRALWPAAVATLAAVCVMPAVALALPEDLRYWFVYVFPPVRMLEFLAGILLARIVRDGLWIGLPVLPAAALAATAYVASGFLPLGFSYVAGTVVPLSLLIAAVAVADIQERPSFLRHRVMLWLGEISFAFYMVHQLVIRFVDRAFGGRDWSHPAGLLVALSMLALALLAAWLLYRLVEKPAMALSRSRNAGAAAVRATT